MKAIRSILPSLPLPLVAMATFLDGTKKPDESILLMRISYKLR